MKVLFACVAGVAGAALGLLLGTIGVFYACILLDGLIYPQGAPPGGGLGAVGWVFVFVTAPAGLMLGAAVGALCVVFGWRRGAKNDPAG